MGGRLFALSPLDIRGSLGRSHSNEVFVEVGLLVFSVEVIWSSTLACRDGQPGNSGVCGPFSGTQSGTCSSPKPLADPDHTVPTESWAARLRELKKDVCGAEHGIDEAIFFVWERPERSWRSL